MGRGQTTFNSEPVISDADYERIYIDFEQRLAALVDAAAAGDDGRKCATITQLKKMRKALDDALGADHKELAEHAPMEAISFYLGLRIARLHDVKIEARRAAAPNYRCPQCEKVFPEYDLATVRECSNESCGSEFIATDGTNCPDCNRPFTRLLTENICPECEDPEAECEVVA